MWVVRVGIMGFATEFDGNPASKGWSRDDIGIFGLNSEDTIIDATTSELRMGTLRFVTSASGNASTAVTYFPRLTNDGGEALWFEDDVATGKTPGSGLFTVGPPVIVVPEPTATAAAALGLVGFGLLARRSGRADS
jgi:hypothetical protein